MMSSRPASIPRARSSANGANASAASGFPAWKSSCAAGGQPAFPPSVVVAVKALACELPARCGVPLSRWSRAELRQEVLAQGLAAEISGRTIWRWLSADAIRPWRYRSWLFPRDPAFAAKAGRILDLYERVWEGQVLQDDDFVLSADEKTSIQARARCHPTQPVQPGSPLKVEPEYDRGGALAYGAASDVHRAKLFGRCEATTGIAPFDRLVAEVMTQEPYRSASRVFWILDNGSAHRGQAAIARLQRAWPILVPVHTPIHASWLNQIEIYFSIVQRNVLTPNDFASLAEVEERLLRFQARYEQIAQPFQWKFTRQDLTALLARLEIAKASFPLAA
jgi:transposase